MMGKIEGGPIPEQGGRDTCRKDLKGIEKKVRAGIYGTKGNRRLYRTHLWRSRILWHIGEHDKKEHKHQPKTKTQKKKRKKKTKKERKKKKKKNKQKKKKKRKKKQKKRPKKEKTTGFDGPVLVE